MSEVQRDCACGESLRASSTPTSAAEDIGVLFDEQHTGDGHGPVSARVASRVRARQRIEETS